MPGSVPVTVCCPKCWTWSQLKNSSICKRCGTPYVLPDGRRLDQVGDSSGDGVAPPAFAHAPTVSLGMPTVEGVNWILIARWITIVYGALTVLGILAVAFLVQHVSVPVQDPNTGGIVYQTVDLRPILFGAGISAALFFALIAWLTGHAAMRIILLVLVVFGALAAFSRMGGEPPAGVVASVISLLFDTGFAFVLAMTFLSPQRAVSTRRVPLPPPLPPVTTAQ